MDDIFGSVPTDRNGVPWSEVRKYENEGAKRRRREIAALRRKVAAVKRIGYDEFLGPLSVLAGLTEREHAVVFSCLMALAHERRPNYTGLGRHYHCSRQAIKKSHDKGKAKLDRALGHKLDLPQYAPYADFDSYADIEMLFDTNALDKYLKAMDDGDHDAIRRAERLLDGYHEDAGDPQEGCGSPVR